MEVKIDLHDISESEDSGEGSLRQNGNGFHQPILEWSEEAAWFHREEITIRPGMSLFIENLTNPEPVYRFDIDNSPLELGVVLSGLSQCHMKNDKGSEKIIKVNSGTSLITYSPKSTGHQVFGDHPLVSVGLYIDPRMLSDYLGSQEDSLPKTFLDLIDCSTGNHFFYFSEVKDHLRDVVMQVLSSSLTGISRNLFLEAKAMEMLALHLENLSSKPSFHSKSLSRREIDKVQMAKDVLVQTFQSPPTIFELAKTVNLTHTRLNQGFRQTFGKTVFEYLRFYRLERAKLLLLNTELSITEIAHETGFSDTSHFIRRFSKVFGVRPAAYRRSITIG